MYILDVISSVSRSSKCNKMVGGWGFAPDPTGIQLTALHAPNPLGLGAYFKASTSKGSGREERGRGRRQNYMCPGRQKPLRFHCSSEVGQGTLNIGCGRHNLKLRHCALSLALVTIQTLKKKNGFSDVL